MTTPSETVDVLASLDESPACECDATCVTHDGTSCPTSARFLVRLAHLTESTACEPLTFLLCARCLSVITGEFLYELNYTPDALCCGCDQPITCIHDFITTVVTL